MQKIIMDDVAIERTLKRIAHEIVEHNRDYNNLVLVGIKRRGIPLANRIKEFIVSFEGINIPVETIDITFYRDDLTKKSDQPITSDPSFKTLLDNKDVVLVDDVVFTGRTVRAAIDALLKHGRPSSIQLAVLIDRGHRELPIRPDYVGKNIPTSKDEHISVCLKEVDDADVVYLNTI